MKRFRNIIALMTLAAIVCSGSSAFAEDNALRDTFQSAFYGGALGALVGGAVMVFTKKPADHLIDMGYGAAIGVMAGTAYGIARSTQALASFDNGRLRIALPTIIPERIESPVTKQTTISWRADLLRGTFN